MNAQYKNIEFTSDRKYLYDHFSPKALKIIDDILEAYSQDKIDFEEPRLENGEPDFTGTYRLIIKDNTYQETGYELLVMQWAENHESTEYMVVSRFMRKIICRLRLNEVSRQ